MRALSRRGAGASDDMHRIRGFLRGAAITRTQLAHMQKYFAELQRARQQKAQSKNQAVHAQREAEHAKLRLETKKQRFTAALELRRGDPTMPQPAAMAAALEYFPSPSPLKRHDAELVADAPPATPAPRKPAASQAVVRTRLYAKRFTMCCMDHAARLHRRRACRFSAVTPACMFASRYFFSCTQVQHDMQDLASPPAMQQPQPSSAASSPLRIPALLTRPATSPSPVRSPAVLPFTAPPPPPQRSATLTTRRAAPASGLPITPLATQASAAVDPVDAGSNARTGDNIAPAQGAHTGQATAASSVQQTAAQPSQERRLDSMSVLADANDMQWLTRVPDQEFGEDELMRLHNLIRIHTAAFRGGQEFFQTTSVVEIVRALHYALDNLGTAAVP